MIEKFNMEVFIEQRLSQGSDILGRELNEVVFKI